MSQITQKVEIHPLLVAPGSGLTVPVACGMILDVSCQDYSGTGDVVGALVPGFGLSAARPFVDCSFPLHVPL